MISFILLPEEPSRFWRVRARDLADVVPHSHLLDAGRETAAALAIQSGGPADHGLAEMLWGAAADTVAFALADVNRLVLDMDYRVTIRGDGDRQLVKAVVTSKRCWRGHDRVFFSFCTDVSALAGEFATPGSISREIVELEPGEGLDDWERRVRTYHVSLVIDGTELPPSFRETISQGHRSRSLRIGFDVADLPIVERLTPMRLVAEFHQAPSDRTFTVKFSNYYCLGVTHVSLELDDPLLEVETNEFMRGARTAVARVESHGLRHQEVSLETEDESVLTPGSGVVFTWNPGPLLCPIPVELVRDLHAQIPDDLPPLPSLEDPPQQLIPTDARAEPLVTLAGVRHVDAYHRLKITTEPRVLMARRSVVDRLEEAQTMLPDGFTLLVLDAWRSPSVQQQVLDYYRTAITNLEDGFVADPQSTTMRPPHVVGGALDLTLAWHGRPLALGTAYDAFTPDARLDAWEDPVRAEPLDVAVRQLRRLLAHVLLSAGFAPYRQEWWHWSYGDDVWASATRRPSSLYDIVTDASIADDTWMQGSQR